MALGTVIRSFAAPVTVPRGITWSGRHLWVSDQGGVDAIYQIDPVTGTIIRSLPTPTGVAGLTWDGEALWLAVPGTQTIYQIDPATGTILRSFASPSTSPQGLAWDGRTLWHTDATSRLIYQLDPVTGTVIRSLGSPSISPLGLTWDGHSLWLSDGNTDLIYQINPITGAEIRSAAAPSTSPAGLAWDGRTLWHVDFQTDLIYQLSVSSEAEYAQLVKSTGPIAYWPQWEPSGVISADISGNLRHGAYTGVDLGYPGIGDGATCPFFDGINDFNNILSAAIAAAFSGAEGSLQLWWLHDPAAHNDAVLRRMFIALVNGTNFLIVAKTGVNGNVQVDYQAGGVSEQHLLAVAAHRTTFSVLHVTWSKAAERITYYDAGAQIGQDLTLGIWAGVPATMVVGATSTVPADPYHGRLAHIALWDYELTGPTVGELAVV